MFSRARNMARYEDRARHATHLSKTIPAMVKRVELKKVQVINDAEEHQGLFNQNVGARGAVIGSLSPTGTSLSVRQTPPPRSLWNVSVMPFWKIKPTSASHSMETETASASWMKREMFYGMTCLSPYSRKKYSNASLARK